MSTVTDVGPVTVGTGEVVLTISAAAVNTYGGSALLFNLGPANVVKRSRYDVNNGVLRSTDLLVAGAAPNPLASNIVNLKMQYGIDDVGDGQLHTWVSATGNWTPANVLAGAADAGGPRRRGALPHQGGAHRHHRPERAVRPSLGDYNWSLFDGTLNGTIAATVAPAGNWRYRIYETIIPLRNELWN